MLNAEYKKKNEIASIHIEAIPKFNNLKSTMSSVVNPNICLALHLRY